MEGMKRTKRQTAEPCASVCIWVCGIGIWTCIGGTCIALLTRDKKGLTRPVSEERGSNKNEGETKTEARVRKANRQRRLIQQRIRRWNKTRKSKYGGKERKKYRHKVRASKRWLWGRSRNDTEAKEANNREHRKCRRKTGGRDMRRKG
eukprot:88561-Pleurochrysis_carterae.AAC.1